jgi:hypothetical protein
VWDLANKHKRQFNEETAHGQGNIIYFDTTSPSANVTY